MKIITKYIAIDGTEFSTEKDCLDYEANGIFQEETNVAKELQRYKAYILKDEFLRFMKLKNSYKVICTQPGIPGLKRAEVYKQYFAAKERYRQTLVSYQRLKNRKKFLHEEIQKRNITKEK